MLCIIHVLTILRQYVLFKIMCLCKVASTFEFINWVYIKWFEVLKHSFQLTLRLLKKTKNLVQSNSFLLLKDKKTPL